MTNNRRRKTTAGIGNRRPYQRLTEAQKRNIVGEVNQGLICIRAACRKYGLNRNTLRSWRVKLSLLTPEETLPTELSPDMTDPQPNSTLSRQVKALTKALAQAQLKISGYQTMIEVAEDKLKIKIRKKSGTKRSNE